jgi:hypothetical protein
VRPRAILCAIALALSAPVPAPRASFDFAQDRAEPRRTAAQPTPVIVELFTSEGCSDCPPADALLQKLIDAPSAGVEIIGLGQHVDYWDRLGWKDRFSSAALTERQRQYANHFNNESIYTPQMVVDGRAEFVGSDAGAARKAIDRSAAMPHGTLRLEVESSAAGHLALAVAAHDLPRASRGDRADIIVAVTEDRLTSSVKTGENHGRTLTHAAVVRHLATIGEATDASAAAHAELTIAPDWRPEHLKLVAFVQERRSRAILASAAVPFSTVR